MIEYVNKNRFKLKKGVVAEYLRSLGIEKPNSFIKHPSESDYSRAENLDKIDKAAELMQWATLNKKKIFVMVDSDTDGITSAAIFHNYFKSIAPDLDIRWAMHKEKEHGVVMELVPEDADMVVLPDAGSNQHKELKELSDRGIKVLVLDHHYVEDVPAYEDVVIVNNQLGDFPNKCLSGAGVVYKFIEYYDKKHRDGDLYELFQDLAALGILADGMDMRSLDNNAIVWNGLRNVVNPMLREFMATTHASSNRVEYKPFSALNYDELQGVRTKRHIIWKITPLINAMIRVGSMEEKERLFHAFTTIDSLELFKSVTPRGRERIETLYQLSARECVNAHGRQGARVTKGMGELQELIDSQGLANDKIIIVKLEDIELPQTLTGLVAMKLVTHYKKPVLLLRPTKDEDGSILYRGSGRANKAKGFSSLRNTLLEIDTVEYAEGHDMALGVGIKDDNMDAVKESLANNLSDVAFSALETVDCEVNDENWCEEALEELADNNHVFYGGGMPEPRMHYRFVVPMEDVRIQGANQDSVKVQNRYVSFVVFKNPKLVAQIQKHFISDMTHLEIETVGSVSYNEWKGRKNLQVLTDTMHVQPLKLPTNNLF